MTGTERLPEDGVLRPVIDHASRGLRDSMKAWEEERRKRCPPNDAQPDTKEEKECMAEPLPNKPVERPKPPIVGQGKNYWHCWAAASSSWRQAVFKKFTSREAFVNQYWNAPEGGLDAMRVDKAGCLVYTDEFLGLMADLRVNFKQLRPVDLSAELVARRLRCHGHLLLFFNMRSIRQYRRGEPPGPAHTVVVYGIDYPNGGYPIKLKVMDPKGDGGHMAEELSTYQEKVALILAWRHGVAK